MLAVGYGLPGDVEDFRHELNDLEVKAGSLSVGWCVACQIKGWCVQGVPEPRYLLFPGGGECLYLSCQQELGDSGAFSECACG